MTPDLNTVEGRVQALLAARELSSLNIAAAQPLAEASRVVTFERGGMLAIASAPDAQHCWFIVDGNVTIVEGNVSVSNQIVGMLALMDGQRRRTATMVAEGSVVAIQIPLNVLLEVMTPELNLLINQRAFELIALLNERNFELAAAIMRR